jgi:tRNA A37 threonylcarbamoyladenosine biosynthesis protein TsaE
MILLFEMLVTSFTLANLYPGEDLGWRATHPLWHLDIYLLQHDDERMQRLTRGLARLLHARLRVTKITVVDTFVS